MNEIVEGSKNDENPFNQYLVISNALNVGKYQIFFILATYLLYFTADVNFDLKKEKVWRKPLLETSKQSYDWQDEDYKKSFESLDNFEFIKSKDVIESVKALNWAWEYQSETTSQQQWTQFNCNDCLVLEFGYQTYQLS